jgi:chromosome segregation ATPase
VSILDQIAFDQIADERDKAQQEIKPLKQHIKQLKEELIDAKNQYAALVADVVLYEDRAERIKRLEETLEGVTDKLDNAWGIYMKFKEAK